MEDISEVESEGIKESRSNRWAATTVTARALAGGAAYAYNDTRQPLSDAAKLAVPQLQVNGATDSLSLQSSLYYAARAPQATAPQVIDLSAGLDVQLPEHFTLEAKQGNSAEFALVVQDDVRGFTAEAHNTAAPAPPASHAGVSADDGVKVEVEFDGAEGTTSF
jgi:hypothetical protein